MKKVKTIQRVAVLLAGVLALAGLASASSVYYFDCTLSSGTSLAQFSGGAGEATATCPGAPSLPTGFIYTEVILWDMGYYHAGDYTYGQPTTTQVQIVEAPNSGTWTLSGWVSSTVTCDLLSTSTSGSGPCAYSTTDPPISTTYETLTLTGAALQAFAMGGFTVNDTATVISGPVALSSLGTVVEYVYQDPPTGVPEPVTPAMVGGAFLALAALARKRCK